MTPRSGRRILLHVGSPKCGSTYLQQVMLRNDALLRAHGIRYPHDGGGHPGNAAGIATLDRATFDAFFEDGVHTVVLSHEDLYSTAQKRGAALADLAREDGAEVRILAFLRPFSEFVFGDYSQFMKQYFEDFLRERRPYNGQNFRQFALRRVDKLKPETFLANWQKRLDGAPVTVDSHRRIRPVMERLLGPGPALDWEVPQHLTNPSLRMEDCDALAAAMRDPAVTDDSIREMFRAAFHRASERGPEKDAEKGPDRGRTRDRIRLIEEVFAPQNRALFEAFGYDNTLPGFPLQPA